MSRAKTQRRATRAAVLPVVVGVRDAQVTRVLGAVAVAVAHKTGLPVVVEVSAGGKEGFTTCQRDQGQLPGLEVIHCILGP